jgi:hypothetical protein
MRTLAWGRRDDAKRARERAAQARRERQAQERTSKSQLRRIVDETLIAVEFATTIYGGQVDPAQVSQTTFDNYSDMREENLSDMRSQSIEEATYSRGIAQTSQQSRYDNIYPE